MRISKMRKHFYTLFLKVFLITLVTSKTYENYHVFEIVPTTNEQVKYLSAFSQDYKYYEFWTEPTAKNQPVHLMVAPEKHEEFSRRMKSSGISYRTHVENVQALIDKQKPSISPVADSKDFSWTRYHTKEEIDSWLESLPERYREVSVVVAGRSYEGRDIKGVKLSFGRQEKPGIFIEAGIHADEWIGPSTATYLLNEFLTSKDPEVRRLATSYDWYIFPVFNPDGYVYTFAEDRLWRKTRVPNENGCFGVDPNRNWGYKWMSGGASDDPCAWSYAGKKPFSEMESKTISEYILSISDKLFAFISFHCSGQLLLLPYGHTKEHLDNYDELLKIGKETIKSLEEVYGTTYEVGNIPEVLYTASGSSMDWMKGVLKLPITFTYELRDKGKYGPLLPPEQIIPNGKEVLNSFLTLFQEASKMGYPNVTTSMKNA